MNSRLNPYISFDGNAKEAMDFYHSVFGGKLDTTTFKDGGMSPDQSYDHKIMHSMLEAENGMVLMVSDTPPGMPYHSGGPISISLSGDNESELKGYWNKLSEEAKITMPLEKAPWGDIFGMLTDKFGVDWLVNISQKQE